MKKIVKDITPELRANDTIKRVAVYARVSCEKDTMVHSLKAQIDYYRKLIMKNPGWKFAGIYADEGKTGTKEAREQFQALLTECRNGNVDMIITKSISRFARNTVTLLSITRELKELGINVYFEDQKMDSMSSDGQLMLTLMAGIAQAESKDCSDAVKWRIRHGYEQGRASSFRILGYRWDDGNVVMVPEEAPLVKRIFDLYLSGKGANAISKILNSEGVTAAGITKWAPTTIRNVLMNEKYYGDLLLQKSFVEDHINKRKVINNGELPQYFIEDDHEAIIDRQAMSDVKNEIAIRRARFYHGQGKESCLTSKIKCPYCHVNYHRKKINGISKWSCATSNRKGKSMCPKSKDIREDVLLAILAHQLGYKDFDEKLFAEQVDYIECFDDHIITHFYDGSIKNSKWSNPSRKDSWTDDMKEKARQRGLNQYGK
jgi:DNA invertase Pin-like site-specific DNA recombinase